jgi:hypothetical protein
MAGFFGLEWTNNATIEVIIEGNKFNNSLSGYDACDNAYGNLSQGSIQAINDWVNVYLQNATERFRTMTEGFEWTVEEVYAAQTMCPYETVRPNNSLFPGTFANMPRLLMATLLSAISSPTMNGLDSNIPLTLVLPDYLHFSLQ